MTDDRFAAVDAAETSKFVESMKNVNTKRKTTSDMKILNEWLAKQNELRKIEDIPVTEVDQILARFFLSVRSQKNEEYEPDTIKSIQTSISRYLLEKKGVNILKDKEFQHSRDVVASKRKQLKSYGLGNKRLKADPFSSEEIKSLYEKNLLGASK